VSICGILLLRRKAFFSESNIFTGGYGVPIKILRIKNFICGLKC